MTAVTVTAKHDISNSMLEFNSTACTGSGVHTYIHNYSMQLSLLYEMYIHCIHEDQMAVCTVVAPVGHAHT